MKHWGNRKSFLEGSLLRMTHFKNGRYLFSHRTSVVPSCEDGEVASEGKSVLKKRESRVHGEEGVFRAVRETGLREPGRE